MVPRNVICNNYLGYYLIRLGIYNALAWLIYTIMEINKKGKRK